MPTNTLAKEQLSLLTDDQLAQVTIDRWTKDDHETPDWLCQEMANLAPKEGRILDAGAGRGRISLALRQAKPDLEVWGVESKRERIEDLGVVLGDYAILGDFLDLDCTLPPVDVVISHPPASRRLEFLERALSLAPRLIFLMPLNFFQNQRNLKRLKELDCHVEQICPIAGQVFYIKDRTVEAQKGDAIFDIRVGRDSTAISFILSQS